MTSRAGISRRTGMILFVLFITIGLLVSLTIDKVYAAEPTPAAPTTSARMPICDYGGGCPTSTVSTKRQGVRKFKGGKLGQAGGIRYPAKAKDIILDKLMAKQRQINRRSMTSVDSRLVSRSQMWSKYTATDNCYYRVKPGPRRAGYWSCTKPVSFPNRNTDWTRGDVDAIICGGVLGIGIGGVMATGAGSGPGAPWVWAGLGAGYAICQWQDNLHRAVD